jgi:transcriptional regulator with XRE-family HTH domain
MASKGLSVDDANGVPQDETQAPTGGGRGAGKAAKAQNGAAVADPRTIGEALRQAREAAGLTLAEVAERTKVRPGILAEIEADDHDRLPALTYSLGFVKAYARTVGMDPIAAAERYRQESRKGDPIPTQVDLQPLEAKRLPSTRLVVATVALLALLVAGFWAWGAGWLASTPPAEPTDQMTAAANNVQPAEPETEEAAAPAADPAAPVTVTAREEVWLRISDGTETLFMGTMTPGQSMALPAGRAWQLRTGRAGALDVKVGGTAVPPLGGPAEQVRNLSLKPEDLLARQARPGLPITTPGIAPGPAPAPAAAPAAPAG